MRALSDVLPANSFEEIDITSDNILKVYKGFDKSGEVVGLVVLSERAGFQSYIKTLTGIDLETRRITRVKILEHHGKLSSKSSSLTYNSYNQSIILK